LVNGQKKIKFAAIYIKNENRAAGGMEKPYFRAVLADIPEGKAMLV